MLQCSSLLRVLLTAQGVAPLLRMPLLTMRPPSSSPPSSSSSSSSLRLASWSSSSSRRAASSFSSSTWWRRRLLVRSAESSSSAASSFGTTAPQPRRVDSERNALVKLARSLRLRKHRVKQGLVLVEGARLICDALASGARAHAILVAEDREAPGIRAAAGAAVVVDAPSRVVDAASDTTSPQGAVGIFFAPTARKKPPDTPHLVLACDAVSDPGNLGALIRTADAASVDAVLIVGAQSADPWSPKALRAAMGSTFRVPFVDCRDGWAAADDLIRTKWGLNLRAADLGPGSAAYDEVAWDRAAVVVGGEVGLSEDLKSLLDGGAGDASLGRVHIPMDPRVESLNAAVAGSAILCVLFISAVAAATSTGHSGRHRRLEARRQLRAQAKLAASSSSSS